MSKKDKFATVSFYTKYGLRRGKARPLSLGCSPPTRKLFLFSSLLHVRRSWTHSVLEDIAERKPRRPAKIPPYSNDKDRPRTFDPPDWAQSPVLALALHSQSSTEP
jgi:hypothetical protein